jgi:hypothetical protein
LRLSKYDKGSLDALGLTNAWDWNSVKYFLSWWWQQGYVVSRNDNTKSESLAKKLLFSITQIEAKTTYTTFRYTHSMFVVKAGFQARRDYRRKLTHLSCRIVLSTLHALG